MPKDKKKKKGLIAEFREFIARGNVIDLAVGVVVGAAFTAIVDSLVNDLIMPLVGWMFGGIDFSGLKVELPAWAFHSDELGVGLESAGVTLNYGNFINAVVNFFLLALVVFIVVKAMNTFRRKKDAAKKAAEPTNQEKLLAEIRDLLRDGQTEAYPRDRRPW